MWQAIAGAAVGGIAGGQKDKQQEVGGFSSSSGVTLKDFKDLQTGAGDLEKQSYDAQLKQFTELLGLVGRGPGQSEIDSNNTYQNSFATQLQSLMQNIQNPNVAANTDKARGLFAPQQTRLEQQFQDQRTEGQRMAARMGRPGNDPILQNKLMQEQSRQQRVLDSEVGSYARQLPELEANNIMNIGGTLSNLRQGLASQALQNRQTLLSMGQQLASSERNWRLGNASHTQSGDSDSSVYSGGGFKGAVTGMMSGASMGMGMGGKGGATQATAGNSYSNMGNKA